ncbi:metallophosphoesterase family protein [Pseudoroseicyclus tamaricis]|uniref:Metallophosphoesterase n=1 Tax=Pseudoroseicyclus tamaricis TaxID=2705421 RepID=A0A6B2K1W0_9RHOB|nr:metallophosphoesterase [Pseudoroseicyclus tamaricis]NDV00386.1 metallophosphoesterase [Pseudoroseicyclus tamaricis]
MARLVHLSDLHFGRTRPELLDPLVEAVNGLSPDLVAVSGDLSQRARPKQFAEAAALLDRLEAPKLVVPGNHDVPLWNMLLRVVHPFRRYREAFGDDKEPKRMLGDVAVIGVNTVNPHRHQRGKMEDERLTKVIRRLEALPEETLKIIVMHHPIVHPPGSDKEPMDGAVAAARAFSRAGADIVLTGHLHVWGAETFEMPDGRALLFIQAGTGLSTRKRGEPNDFNLIDCSPGQAEVTRYCATEAADAFVPAEPEQFIDGAEGWVKASDPEARPVRGAVIEAAE